MSKVIQEDEAGRRPDIGVRPRVDSEEEVRFAVVMYGGVSLAIYINGVTQELFNMVCATAPDRRNGGEARLESGELTGSQRVYRRLGQYLQQWQDLQARREGRAPADGDYDALRTVLLERPDPAAPIRTRFIVDVLSGTSAGGINAIYLAKALANVQGLDGIRKLWISEGDMAKLINDHRSDEGLPPKSKEQKKNDNGPRSLLNSRRMYCKLLDALVGMRRERVGRAPPPDGNGEPDKGSPLVDELDLFITTTDIEGLTLPITLTDKVTYEKRHRNVFHFRYDKGGVENDFKEGNDPFLAYAARCTSSFPFAFEPMALKDIEQVAHPAYPKLEADTPGWRKFYSEYWRPSVYEVDQYRLGNREPWTNTNVGREQEQLQKQFLQRAFGDGGYLDNKPFSYATSMTMRRAADVPVRRKLLYVEPVPAHPEQTSTARTSKPDFAENIRAAVLELPGKEMIREDIERVLERNRLLRRVSSYTRDVDNDIARIADFPLINERRAQPVSTMLNRYGVAYGAYHRLRIDDTSQRLGEMLAKVAGFDPDSSASAAVRELVVAWRKSRYREEFAFSDEVVASLSEQELADLRKTLETGFLYQFDLQFPLRRLSFISRRINQLARLDDTAKKLLRTWWSSEKKRLGLPERQPWDTDSQSWNAKFREALSQLKKSINQDRGKWRRLEEELAALEIDDLGSLLEIKWSQLSRIIELAPEDRAKQLEELVRDNTNFDMLAGVISAKREQLGALYKSPDLGKYAPIEMEADFVAQACIDFYFSRYPFYDMVSFPVQYGTGSTEANEIDVFRVSPEDATLMFDERLSGRRKLAGTTLMNFGAFIEESWRRNDMLWGRLDAVERIVCAVMPVAKGDAAGCRIRDSLIQEAQAAILEEDLTANDRDVLSEALLDCLAADMPVCPDAKAFRDWMEDRLGKADLCLAMKSAIRSCMDGDSLWEYYSDVYKVDRGYDAEQAVRSMARASAVTAHMLQELARDYRVNSKAFGWLAMFASMFWGVVEAAVPRSLANLLFRHWLGVAYLIALAIVGIGMLTSVPEVTTAGWIALAVTVGVHGLFKVTGYYIASSYERHPVWAIAKYAAKFALAAAVVALLVGGVLFYVESGRQWLSDRGIAEWHIYLASAGLVLACWLTGRVVSWLRGLIGKLRRR